MKILKAPSGLGVNPGGCGKRISGLRHLDLFDGVVVIGILLYSVFFSYLSLFRYNSFQLEYDLAVFNQAFWNTVINGELLTNSLTQCSQFGIHFSPIILTLVPFYALSPGPHTLLIAQSVLLGLGAIPIYLCGREILGKGVGCAIGFVYLFYPSLHGVNLYDFHEVAFLPFLLGMALWGFVTGRRNMLLLFGFLSLLVKEDVSLILIMIGIIGLYTARNNSNSDRWQYIILILIAVLTLSFFFGIIRPMFAASSPMMESGFIPQYLDPVNTLSQHNENRIMYVLMTFLPLLFIPLGSPEIFIISIPSFLEILLSPNPYYFSIMYQYSALVIPVLFIATIMTLSRVRSGEGRFGKRVFIPLLCMIIMSTIISSAVYSPAVNALHMKGTIDEKAMNDHREYLNLVISLIPRDASISTQYNLLPQVSSRKQIWVDYHEGADIILLDNAFSWRAKDFSDNQKEIDDGYDLVLKKEYVTLYVNNNNASLRSELNKSISSF